MAFSPSRFKSDTIDAFPLDLTPEMASLIVGNFNNKNPRPGTARRVARYASNMSDALWVPGVAGLGFNRDGTLRNGQKVCRAVAESETTQTVIVTVGLPNEADPVFDALEVRSLKQAVKLMYADLTQTEAGIVQGALKALAKYELIEAGKRSVFEHGSPNLANPDYLDMLATRYQILLHIAREIRNSVPHGREKVIGGFDRTEIALLWTIFGAVSEGRDVAGQFIRDFLHQAAPLFKEMRSRGFEILAKHTPRGYSANRTLLVATGIRTWNTFLNDETSLPSVDDMLDDGRLPRPLGLGEVRRSLAHAGLAA